MSDTSTSNFLKRSSLNYPHSSSYDCFYFCSPSTLSPHPSVWSEPTSDISYHPSHSHSSTSPSMCSWSANSHPSTSSRLPLSRREYSHQSQLAVMIFLPLWQDDVIEGLPRCHCDDGCRGSCLVGKRRGTSRLQSRSQVKMRGMRSDIDREIGRERCV